jgi:hypothetical protein
MRLSRRTYMKTKLALGLIASSFLFVSVAAGQGSGQHSRHHSQLAGQHRMGKKPAMGMCCCMQGGMMGSKGMAMQAMPMPGMPMQGMSGMRGMQPMPPMGGQKMEGMPGQMTPPPMGGMMDAQMMADMQAQDQKLEGLVKAMNEASQDAKLDAAIAVINEMSAQHAAMKKMMMGHMGQMRGMGGPNPPQGK